MPADLSKSVVHGAEHFRTILYTVNPVTAAGVLSPTFTLPTLPTGCVMLGVGPAASYDNIETTTPGTNRSYTVSPAFGAAAASGGTVTVTSVGAIATASIKEITLAVTIFSPAGL